MKTLESPTTGLIALLLAPLGFAQAQFATLYSFNGQDGDGAQPYAGLTVANDSLLYGTTVYGGTSAAGTVFRLKPPAEVGGEWQETVLYSFAGGTDGANPYGGVVFGLDGALYGTTAAGGTANAGTVFKLSPPGGDGRTWKETVLHDFGAIGDGVEPKAGLILGSGGKLYGTTYYGGPPQPYPSCYPSGCGTVFEMVPPTAAGAAWTETVLYAFVPAVEGGFGNPAAALAMSQGGALYGTTVYGGGSGPADGTVFELKPPASAGDPWTETTIHNFGGDDINPYGALAIGKNGDLYGTTSGYLAGNSGTAFQLKPPDWIESAYDFPYAIPTDGSQPYAGLVIGPDGALFGTTYTGGMANAACAALGCGTVFKLTPPTSPGAAWTEVVLHEFSGENGDGAEPYAPLAFGAHGVLYGTTFGGGTSGWGTIFALVP